MSFDQHERSDWTIMSRHFLNWCSNTGLKELTIEAYDLDLRQLTAFMEGIGVKPLEWTEAQVLGFLKHMKDNGAATSSIARKVASIRCFGSYLQNQGLMGASPVAELRVSRKPACTERVLEWSEMRLLANRVKVGTRDRCMVELLLAGLSNIEITGLRWEQVDLLQGVVRFGERLVTLHDEAVANLQDYQHKVKPTLRPCKPYKDHVFLNYAGRSVSRQCIWKLVNSLDRDVNAQTLRRSSIVHLLRSGIDPQAVAQQTGHQSVASLDRYLPYITKKKRA